jgi:hypothetical protein
VLSDTLLGGVNKLAVTASMLAEREERHEKNAYSFLMEETGLSC